MGFILVSLFPKKLRRWHSFAKEMTQQATAEVFVHQINIEFRVRRAKA
jgi:hypothetical protein